MTKTYFSIIIRAKIAFVYTFFETISKILSMFNNNYSFLLKRIGLQLVIYQILKIAKCVIKL